MTARVAWRSEKDQRPARLLAGRSCIPDGHPAPRYVPKRFASQSTTSPMTCGSIRTGGGSFA
jgi:hypothetical protein